MPLEGATGWPGVGHKNNITVTVPPHPSPYPQYMPQYPQPAAGPAALDANQAQKIITDLEMIMQMLAEQKQMPSAPPAFQPQPSRPPPPYAPQAYQQPYPPQQQNYPPYQPQV
jgi:hypothetical protein